MTTIFGSTNVKYTTMSREITSIREIKWNYEYEPLEYEKWGTIAPSHVDCTKIESSNLRNGCTSFRTRDCKPPKTILPLCIQYCRTKFTKEARSGRGRKVLNSAVPFYEFYEFQIRHQYNFSLKIIENQTFLESLPCLLRLVLIFACL